MDEIKNTESEPDPDDKDDCNMTCAKCESNAVLNADAFTVKNTPRIPDQGHEVDQGITDMTKQSDATLVVDYFKNNVSKPGQDDKVSLDTTNAKKQSKSTLSVHTFKAIEGKCSQDETAIGSDTRYNLKEQSNAVLTLYDAKKSVSKSDEVDKEGSDTINVKKQFDLVLNTKKKPETDDKVDSDKTNIKNQSDVVLSTNDDCDTCAKCESNAILNADAFTVKNTPRKPDQGHEVDQGITDMKKQSDTISIADDFKNNVSKPGQDDKVSLDTTNAKKQSKSTLSVHNFKAIEGKCSQDETAIGSDTRYNLKEQSNAVLTLYDAKKSVSKSDEVDKEGSDTINVKKQSDLVLNTKKKPKTDDKLDSDKTNIKNQSDVVWSTNDDCDICAKCQPHAVLDAGNFIVKSTEKEPTKGHQMDQDATDLKKQSDIIMNTENSKATENKPDQDHKLDSTIIKNEENSKKNEKRKIEAKDGDKDEVKSEEKGKEKVESKTTQDINSDTLDVKKVILDDIYKDEKISTDFEKKTSRKRKGFKCPKLFSKTKLKKTGKEVIERTYKEEEKNPEMNEEKRLKETENIIRIDENEWFIQLYEKCIGKKRKIIQTNPAILIEDLKMKAMTRFTPESMFYQPQKPGKPEDSLFLSWKGPVVPKCTCPYRECFCRGDTKFLKEKPSYFNDVVKRAFYAKWRRWNLGIPRVCLGSSNIGNAGAKALYNKVKERLALEEEYYKKAERKKNVHKLNPEFCFEKCYHCDHPNERNLRTTQFLPLFMYGKQEKEVDEDGKETESEDEVEPGSKQKDGQICNIYNNTCTVSAQTDPIGADGNFILPTWLENKVMVGKQVLLPSTQNSIFSNIEGSKIEINPYTELKEDELEDRMDECAQKMLSFSFKDIKSRLSKLLSSILEIKDSGVPINTRCTQLPCRGVCDDTDDCFTGFGWRHKGSKDYICGAVDYDFLPEIPYTERLSVSDIQKAYEQHDSDPCPCCNMYDRNRSREAYEKCFARKQVIITPRKNVYEKFPDLTQKVSDIDIESQVPNSIESLNVQNTLPEKNKSQDSNVGIKNKENGSFTSKNEAKDGNEIINKVNSNIHSPMSETEPQKDLDVINSISSNKEVKLPLTCKSSPRTLEERCDFSNTTNVINQLSGSKNSVRLSITNMKLKSGSDIKKVPVYAKTFWCA